MNFKKIVAAVAAAAVAVSMVAVNVLAAQSETISTLTLKSSDENEKLIQWPINALAGVDGVNTVTLKGKASLGEGWCGGGGQFGFESVDGWKQVDFALDGANVTLDSATGEFTVEFTFAGEAPAVDPGTGIIQVGWWWGSGDGNMELVDVLVNGTSIIGLSGTFVEETPAEEATEETTEEAPAEEEAVEEEAAEEEAVEEEAVEEETAEEEAVEEEAAEEEAPAAEATGDAIGSVDMTDYMVEGDANGTVYILADKETDPNWSADTGISPTEVYGVKYYVEFNADEVAVPETWIGGGIGANSQSTGWLSNEWGRADKAITADLENGTITWLSDAPVFADTDTYCQFWLQTWGGTVTIKAADILDADGNVIGSASEGAAEAETEAAPEADATTEATDTGNVAAASLAAVMALAGAAAVASKKRN